MGRWLNMEKFMTVGRSRNRVMKSRRRMSPELLSGCRLRRRCRHLVVGKFCRKRQPVGHVGGERGPARDSASGTALIFMAPPACGQGARGSGTQVYADVYAEGVFRAVRCSVSLPCALRSGRAWVKDRLVPCLFRSCAGAGPSSSAVEERAVLQRDIRTMSAGSGAWP